jgi:hypothetical protein
MRPPSVVLSSIAALACCFAAVSSANAAVLKGTYKGTATKDVSRDGKKTRALSFAVKVMADCPTDGVNTKRTLCLQWRPWIGVPVTCKSDDGGALPKITHETRDVPFASAVSRDGHVNLLSKVGDGSASQATRVLVHFKGSRATGLVRYRSNDAASSCFGELSFRARRV